MIPTVLNLAQEPHAAKSSALMRLHALGLSPVPVIAYD